MQYLSGVIFSNQTMTPKAFGVLIENIIGDGILSGCGISYSGKNITISEGYLVIKGRVIQVTSSTTEVTSPLYASGYGRLKIVIDLSNTSTATINQQAYITTDYSATTSFNALTKENINGNGTKYEVEVGIIGYTDSTITSFNQTLNSAAVKLSGLSANKVVVTDGGGNITTADPTTTEINYISGVTSKVQTQLNDKQKKITYGTSAPTGGSDGDIYIKFI